MSVNHVPVNQSTGHFIHSTGYPKEERSLPRSGDWENFSRNGNQTVDKKNI